MSIQKATIVFYISGFAPSVKELAQTFYDRITQQEILWTEEQFNNEKLTVLQEYGDSFNSPEEGAMSNMFRTYYGSVLPIGNRADIEQFTYEQSLEWAKNFFTHPQLVCEVGESYINTEKVITSKAINRINSLSVSKSLYEEIIPKADKTFVGLVNSKPFTTDTLSKISLIVSCLSSGLESPLYQEVREKRGLAYSVSPVHLCFGNEHVLGFCASTDNNRAQELEDVFSDFFATPLMSLINRDRFDTCKQGLLIKEQVAKELPHSGVTSTVLDPNNPFKNIAEFTYEQVEHYSELFNIYGFHKYSK